MHPLFGMLLLALVLAMPLGTQASDKAAAVAWTEDQRAIIEVNRWVPLAPKEAGFDAYAALFHPDYTNWYMVGG